MFTKIDINLLNILITLGGCIKIKYLQVERGKVSCKTTTMMSSKYHPKLYLGSQKLVVL